MNQKEKNVEVSENFKNKINQLEEQMEEMTENRKVMEQENFDRLVSSAEKEYEYSQKYKENLREYERVKNELNVAQEYLRLATDRNSELQVEMLFCFPFFNQSPLVYSHVSSCLLTFRYSSFKISFMS